MDDGPGSTGLLEPIPGHKGQGHTQNSHHIERPASATVDGILGRIQYATEAGEAKNDEDDQRQRTGGHRFATGVEQTLIRNATGFDLLDVRHVGGLLFCLHKQTTL